MKYMKRIDFLIQTMMLLAALVLTCMGLADPGVWVVIMLIQFIVGVWQYVGGIIWLVFYPKIKPRKVHMILATTYLIILFTTDMLNQVHGNKFYAVYVFGLSWLLAIYYYVITWRSVFPKMGKLSKFLPHISF